MRVLVFGAGGVGGYLGTKLSALADLEVDIVARGEHLKAMQKDALRVIDNGQNITSKAKAVATPEGVYDLVLITTKTTDLDDAVESIENHISKSSVIIPIMNGVDNAKRVREKIEDATILNGCIYIISNIKSAGVIEKKGDVFKLCWGDSSRDLEQFKGIEEIFEKAGFRQKLTKEIDLELWRKFLFISPMALLTSYYSLGMREIYDTKRDKLESLMFEILELADAEGIFLSISDVKNNLLQASKVQKGAKTSMQLDIEQKRESEVESLVGFVVREAKRLNIDVPRVESLYKKLKSEVLGG